MAKKVVNKIVKAKKASISHKVLSKRPNELHELEVIVGQFMEYWGFKEIHGRIWTHLFTSKNPLDSIELMTRLEVSKGLMSIAIRDLLDHDVVKADHVGRHGSTFYKANPDLMAVISNVLKNREAKMLSKAKKASENLMKIKPEKLDSFGLSVEKVKNVLELATSGQLLLQMFLEEDHHSQTSLLLNSPIKS